MALSCNVFHWGRLRFKKSRENTQKTEIIRVWTGIILRMGSGKGRE